MSIVVACIAFAIIAGAAWIAITMREEAFEKARQDNRRLATVLAAQTERLLQAVDLVLKDIAGNTELRQAETPAQFAAIMGTRERFDKLVARASGLPQVAWLSAVNADGSFANTTLGWPPPTINIADRPYFQAIQQASESDLSISEPIVSRTTGTSIIVIMRRIAAPDGRFLGMLASAVRIDYLDRFYAALNLPPGMAIRLLRRDGVILTTFPTKRPAGAATVIPRPLQWHRVVAAGGGEFWSSGAIDGTVRLISVRPVDGYPVVVDVGLLRSAMIGPWLDKLIEIGLVVICALAGLGVLLQVLLAQFKKLGAARDELAAIGALNEQIVENAPVGIYIYHPDGQCVLANPAATRMAGAPRELVIAQNFRHLASWRPSGLLDTGLAVLADGVPRVCETKTITTFGKHLWVHARFSLAPVAGVPHLLLIADDISERKMLESELESNTRALEQRERDLRSILDNMPSPIASWGRDGRNKFANYPYLAWFGVDLERMPGMHLRDLLGEQRYKLSLPYIEAALRGEPQIFERSFPAPDGSKIRHGLTCYVPEIHDGEVHGFYALTSDVSALKETEQALRAAKEEAEQANRAKSEFLATMSHEIRSPMSGLIGVLELLQYSNLTPEQSSMAEMVHGSATSLLGVLNDVLDFSKIEAGGLALVVEPAVVRDLVNDTVMPHQITALQKNLTLTVSLADDLPDVIEIDSLRLRQILNNLLSNALKFTKAGKVEVEVDAQRDTARPQLRFLVRDTGIGMTEDVTRRLFQPFMQADASTTRNFGGTGLGLSISRRLAELLGGTLDASSRPGEGSEFTLVLPLTIREAPSSIQDLTAERKKVNGPLKARVLIADDDPTIRWLTQRQVSLLGLETDVAENGEAALLLLRAGRYDLLLTDCHMPRMDGVALASAVRADPEPMLRNIPIIGLTADATADQRERCRAAGMTDMAIKPLSRADLGQLLGRHLAGSVGVERPEPLARPNPVLAFDPAMFQEIFSPNEPEGRVWLSDFLASAEGVLEELSQRLAEDPIPADAVAALAHRLVGSAGSTGARRLGDVVRTLEQAARAGDLAALPGTHSLARRTLTQTREAITTFLEKIEMELTR